MAAEVVTCHVGFGRIYPTIVPRPRPGGAD
jgi:hypothetical protein